MPQSVLPLTASVSLANDPRLLPALGTFVGEFARALGFVEKGCFSISRATVELAHALIHHALSPENHEPIDATVLQTAAGVEVLVRTKSGLFADERVIESGDGEFAEFGVCVHRLVDAFYAKNLGRDGYEIRIVKHRESGATPPSDSQPTGGDPHAEDPSPPPTQAPTDVHVMRPEEALGVVECFYDCYGYTSIREDVYYPERLIERSQNGELFSVVVTAEDGEVAGFGALEFSESSPRAPECGMGVVKQKFRAMGILERAMPFAVSHAIDQGFPGLRTREVTSHIFSQKGVHRMGFRDTGFVLGRCSKGLTFQGIEETRPLRESLVASYLPLGTPSLRTVFVPQEHREIITEIYDQAGIPVTVETPGVVASMADDTSVVLSVSGYALYASVHVPTIGKDALLRLRHETRKLHRLGIEVINVYLNASDPSAPALAEALKGSGFFFCGIWPGNESGDEMILVHLGRTVIEYEAIKLYSEFAQGLLAYVRRQDPSERVSRSPE